MFLFDRNPGLKYEIGQKISLAVKIYQFYTELFESNWSVKNEFRISVLTLYFKFC